MKLKTLTLQNFQSTTTQTLDFNGCSASIYGANDTGKTTLNNALCWLLLNKPSTDEAGYSPKPRDANGVPIHQLETSVVAVFDIDNRDLTLKKTLTEKWARSRGSKTDKYDGDTCAYEINTVPTTATEYIKFLVESFGSIENLAILTSLYHFPRLRWEIRRKYLFDMCGYLLDEEIIAANPILHELPEILNGKTVECFQKSIASKMKSVDAEMKAIPARIAEVQLNKPHVTTSVSQAELDEILSVIAKLRDKRQILLNTNGRLEHDEIVSDMFKQYARLRDTILCEWNKKNSAIHAEIVALQKKIADKTNELQKMQNQICVHRQTLQNLITKRQALIDELNLINYAKWDGSDICPTCEQSLPIEQIDAAKKRFNLNKSQKLEEIQSLGKSQYSQAHIAEEDRLGQLLVVNVQRCTDEITALNIQLSEAQMQLNNLPAAEDDEQLKLLKSQMENMKFSTTDVDTSVIDKQITEHEYQANAIRDNLAQLNVAKQLDIRIAQLMQQETTLAAEYEQLEKCMNLCQQFTKYRIDMTAERINALFPTVRFEMFESLINGGVRECCEILVECKHGLVPFESANTASRINAAVEIIDSISKHLGVSVPLFVDGCESVTQLKESNLQIIRLIVSADDENLRVELN